MREPCDMIYIVTAEEMLTDACKEDWDGGIILLGFRKGEGYRYICPIKDRYAAAGHLLDMAMYLLSDEGEEDDDDDATHAGN